MWPGIENGDELEIEEDAIVGIENSTGELVCIGAYMISEIPESGKGKAVYNMNFIGDHLWKMGCQEILQPAGKGGGGGAQSAGRRGTP